MFPVDVMLGKQAAKIDPRTLQLSTYAQSLPAPPNSWDVPSALRKSHFGMMANNKLGDCTSAARGHLIQVWTYFAKGKMLTLSDADIIKFYSATTGYVPGDPNTDQGGIELDILKFWRKNSFDGNPLTAFVGFNPRHRMSFKDAIYYFGGAYLGIALPKCIQGKSIWAMADHRGPDTEPGSWGGHAVVSPWYNSIGPVVISWGELIQTTWDFMSYYCDESYALLSPDWMNQANQSPTGFDFTLLQKDLALVAAA